MMFYTSDQNAAIFSALLDSHFQRFISGIAISSANFGSDATYSASPSTSIEASFLAAQRRLRCCKVFFYLVAFVLVCKLYLFGGANYPVSRAVSTDYFRSSRVRSHVLVTGFNRSTTIASTRACSLLARFTVYVICAYASLAWKKTTQPLE